MSNSTSRPKFRWPARHSIYIGLITIGATALTVAAMFIPQTLGANVLPLAEGDVATQDLLAPYAFTFESEVLTEQRRQEAADSVVPYYILPDSSIARTQFQELNNALSFIDNLREDEELTREQLIADLVGMQTVNLDEETAASFLNLPGFSWEVVKTESVTVLEQVMRSSIREDHIFDAKASVINLISLSLTEEQLKLVNRLVTAFIAVNSLYDEEATEAERENARQSEPPAAVSYKKNETIVQRGEVITSADLEALKEFGLVQTEVRLQERISIVSLVAASITLIALYLRYQPELINDSLSLTLLAVLFLLFLLGARLTIPGRTVIPYIYPIAGFSLVVTSLFKSQVAVVAAVPLGILAAYGLPNSLDLTLYYVLGSVCGALVLSRAQRITTYFWAGATIAAVGALVIMAYRLSDSNTDMIGMATLLGASAVNGMAAASITILLQFFLAPVLGLTTTLQLHEISRADHRLLQFILRNAPGTYQHSLQIANLAEQAAEMIGANALLTRVGALYHDAGKARYPHFFIENQIPGSINPHDELNPKESAEVIIRHVPDGLDLAKKYRLPRRIRDFIAEHHGTTTTRFQYSKAIEAASGDRSKVDISDYQYAGPRPKSRETALVMLADGCEARTRAERPTTREEQTALVKDIFDIRMADGQLDDTGLTMRDMSMTIESFVSTLRGIYHPRILYPKFDQETKPVDKVKSGAGLGGDSPSKSA